MAVLFTNNRWLFGLILVLFLHVSSANHYERKNGNCLGYLYAYLSLNYSFLNTDAISCSLVHPCPPGYYCSIILGETGVCHVEDESINQVFSGGKEHTEDNVKREVGMSKYYQKEAEDFDELDEEDTMEEEENENSYEEEYEDEDFEIEEDEEEYEIDEDEDEEFEVEKDEEEYEIDEDEDFEIEEDEEEYEIDEDEEQYEEDEDEEYEVEDDEEEYEIEEDEEEYEIDDGEEDGDEGDGIDDYEQEQDVHDDEKYYRRKRFSSKS